MKFLEGFTHAAYTGSADAVLELAFPVEGSWRTVQASGYARIRRA